MKIALGTAQFGLAYGIANKTGQIPRAIAREMLHLAFDSGVDTVDTAIAYGESEACLGEIGVRNFRVVTKLPPVPEKCADVTGWVRREIGDSIARLGVPRLGGLLLHRPQQLVGEIGELLYESLLNARSDGLVSKIGVSVYGPEELQAILPRFEIDLVQAPLNLVDRRILESGLLEQLQGRGVEVHTRSAFLQGLLMLSQDSLPGQFSRWYGMWNKWHSWLRDRNVSALEACLAFPLSRPEVDRVVVGADSVAQLEQIVRVASSSLELAFPDIRSDDELLVNPSLWKR